MKSIVVTGVSTGIGRATAGALIERGYRVFGSVRKEEDAQRLSSEMGDSFQPLLFDVTDPDAIDRAAAQVQAIVGDLGLFGLVNNAGIAIAGPVMHVTVEEYRQQFEVNFFGQIAVIQAFLPLLGARSDCPHPPGRIVNMSSVSGRIAMPFLSPYAASKFALEALSDSLRRELMLYGIDVLVIEPGPIRTPIWDKAEIMDPGRVADSDFYDILMKMQANAISSGRNAPGPEQVAIAVIDALERKQPAVRTVVRKGVALTWWLALNMPTRWVDHVVAKRLGLRR